VADRHGRIVDEDVYSAEPIDRGLHQPLELVLLRQVRRDRERLATKGFELAHRLADGAR
jgi:hypothetical protein